MKLRNPRFLQLLPASLVLAWSAPLASAGGSGVVSWENPVDLVGLGALFPGLVTDLTFYARTASVPLGTSPCFTSFGLTVPDFDIDQAGSNLSLEYELVDGWSNDFGTSPASVNQPDGYHQPQWRPFRMDGGMPGLRFDGNDRLESATGMPADDYTKVVVFQIEEIPSESGRTEFHLFSDPGGAQELLVFRDVDDDYYVRLTDNGFTVDSAVSIPVGRTFVAIASVDVIGSSRKLRLRLLGSEGTVDTQERTFVSGILTITEDFAIGAGPDVAENEPDGFTGMIGEVLLYDAVKSPGAENILLAVLAYNYMSGLCFGDKRLPALSFDPGNEFPLTGQLFPRVVGTSASAPLQISGTVLQVNGTPWAGAQMELTVESTGTVAGYSECLPDTTDPTGGFAFTVPALPAVLDEYEFTLSLRLGPFDFPLETATRVVSGDVYAIDGHSNALTHNYGLPIEPDYVPVKGDFIRSFGTSGGRTIRYDLHWDAGQYGYAYEFSALHWFQGHSHIGTLGLSFADALIEHTQRPVAVINGAAGSSLTQRHAKTAPPEDEWEHNIYEQIVERCAAAGILDAVRGMIWHCGAGEAFETPTQSDTLCSAPLDADCVEPCANPPMGITTITVEQFPSVSAAAYEAYFRDNIHGPWSTDYPGMQGVYIIQNANFDACLCPNTDHVRHAQLALADDPLLSPPVHLTSSTKAPGMDGCHWPVSGYVIHGQRVADLVFRDLPGSTFTPLVAPRIVAAEWTDAAMDTLRLVFEDPTPTLVWGVESEQDFVFYDSAETYLPAVSAAAPAVTTSMTGEFLVPVSGDTSLVHSLSYRDHRGAIGGGDPDGNGVINDWIYADHPGGPDVGALATFLVPVTGP